MVHKHITVYAYERKGGKAEKASDIDDVKVVHGMRKGKRKIPKHLRQTNSSCLVHFLSTTNSYVESSLVVLAHIVCKRLTDHHIRIDKT